MYNHAPVLLKDFQVTATSTPPMTGGHTAGKENKNKGTDEFRKVFSDAMISF